MTDYQDARARLEKEIETWGVIIGEPTSLTSDLQIVIAENARLDDSINDAVKLIDELVRIANKNIDEVKRLTTALEFYADDKNWLYDSTYTHDVDLDRGEVAKKALGKEVAT